MPHARMPRFRFAHALSTKVRPRHIVLLAVLIAAASRIFAIDTLPPTTWFDEVWFALKAREFLQTGALQPFYKTFWGGVHPFMVFFTALAQLAGFDSPSAARLISAPAGISSVALTYACLTRLLHGSSLHAWRRWVSALAALLLAALPSWIIVARIGLEWPVAATLTLLIIWLYHRAQQTRDVRSVLLFAACGVVLGASQYLSQHMRFVLPLLALYSVHDLLSCHTRRRELTRGLLLSLAAALIVCLPLIDVFVRDPALLTARAAIITNTHGQSRLSFLLGNLGAVAQSFFWRGSQSTLENIPGRALFDPVQMIGFGIGFLWALSAVAREAAARKLLLWLLLLSFPTILTEGAPSFERMTHALPAAAALAAIGWVMLWRARAARPPLRPWPWLAAAVLALSSLNSVALYFTAYARAPTLRDDFTAHITTLTRDLIAQSATEAVFADRITEAENAVHFDYLLPATAVRYLDFRQCLPLTDRRATATTYALAAGRDPRSLELLRALYPDAAIAVKRSESTWLIDDVTVLSVPAGTPLQLPAQPADIAFAPGMRLIGYTLAPERVRAGDSVFFTLYWHAQRDIQADYTAFVHIAADAASPPTAQRDGPPCQGFYPSSLWRAGDVVADSFAVTIPADAPAGAYQVFAGWYQFPSLERAALASPIAGTDGRAQVAVLQITR